MGVLLGLLSALGYGASDFVAGVGGRRSSVGALTIVAQPLGLVTALVAIVIVPGHGPTSPALWWGALGGVGSGVGTVSLYRGFVVGKMGVVSPLSAVLTALIPVAAGLALGEVPSVIVLAGVALAVPAAALISTQHDDSEGPASGAGYGVAAGIGFGVLFVALDQAGTASGAWPLLPGQIVALLVVIPLALHWSSRPLGWRLAVLPGAAAGTLGGIANLLFLAATGAGQLAVVAVLTALYPGVTLLLAGAVLGERWERVQVVGLLVAAAAIILITTG